MQKLVHEMSASLLDLRRIRGLAWEVYIDAHCYKAPEELVSILKTAYDLATALEHEADMAQEWRKAGA